MSLTHQAQRILQLLVSWLKRDDFDLRNRGSYPAYGAIHELLDLTLRKKTPGLSLDDQGLRSLAEWLRDQNLPAITGLIVNESNHLPSGAYFELYGRQPGDVPWLESQIAQADAIDWATIIRVQNAARPLTPLPDILPRKRVEAAILRYSDDYPHHFDDSRYYDLIFHGRRLPPKAIAGIAAELETQQVYTPRDFAGGEASKCFKLLREAGFTIVPKETTPTYPDEVLATEPHLEGAVRQVFVNAYERNSAAREKCIEHFGVGCQVCSIDFGELYGDFAAGFIHVHHIRPISSIGREYQVDPIADLIPVCPNCHAMLHRGVNPPSIEELRSRF